MARRKVALWALVGVAAVVLALGWGAFAADPAPDAAALVKRGDYLVNQVAHCGECHTARDAKGNLDMTRHLWGAKIWFTPKVKPEDFEDKAPDITASGVAGKWSEAKMIRFFMNTEEASAPMPRYRLTEDDAKAVTAYLRSLKGSGKPAGRDD